MRTAAKRGLMEDGRGGPSRASMHFAFVLTGLGTAMLGPLLPLLTREWHLRDEQGGLLLFAQFCGSFLGGATVGRRLRRDLLLGMVAAAVGVAVFAVAPGLPLACPMLLLTGFGLGHSITAVNILAGQRFRERRASALALLNFFWSFGAMLAPLLTGALAPHVALRTLLLAFAGLFAVCGAVLWFEMRGQMDREEAPEEPDQAKRRGIAPAVFVYFAGMLFLYGGLETSLSGWLTTYALRYGDRTLLLSESATFLLWFSLTAGRAGSAAVLRRVRETVVWRVALVLSAVLTAVLAGAHGAIAIGAVTVLLGLSLAPWFPVTFSLLMGERPRERQAGLVIAVSGLGAASLPWLMGALSTWSGSLQRALLVPLLAALLLLGMSFASGRMTTAARVGGVESGGARGRREGV